mgnify:FL=1
MANKPYRIYRSNATGQWCCEIIEMKRLALLLGAIAVSTVFAFGQRIPYMAKIADGVYIDVAEVSVAAWLEYDRDISNRYGANSPQRQAIVPDSLVFSTIYGYTYEKVKHQASLNKQYRNCPVVGLSREQCEDYCAWRTEKCKGNKRYQPKGKSVVFLLPSVSDYAMASDKAKTTNRLPGATVKAKKFGRINGLHDNVPELLATSPTKHVPAEPHGFRCIARMAR